MANTSQAVRYPSEPHLIDLQKRVGRVEASMIEARQEASKRDTQIALMKSDITSIKGGQEKIFGGINKILWAIGLSVLAAGTTFVLSGGFVIVQQ